MGWASHYAHIWGAIVESRKPNPKPYVDYWGYAIPLPIPQRGAKVTVTGRYGRAHTVLGALPIDPTMGILAYEKLQWIEPPPRDPELSGMR
jgi:hypothetical protein